MICLIFFLNVLKFAIGNRLKNDFTEFSFKFPHSQQQSPISKNTYSSTLTDNYPSLPSSAPQIDKEVMKEYFIRAKNQREKVFNHESPQNTGKKLALF
mmetsp:Transcript_38216/g.43830  ORF Transcript_38216/g.43830 Transcript_38216/m.43830 type:complete len:98 (+) Transcript_38216:35-328(+)